MRPIFPTLWKKKLQGGSNRHEEFKTEKALRKRGLFSNTIRLLLGLELRSTKSPAHHFSQEVA
jgi:hypothetical protein